MLRSECAIHAHKPHQRNLNLVLAWRARVAGIWSLLIASCVCCRSSSPTSTSTLSSTTVSLAGHRALGSPLAPRHAQAEGLPLQGPLRAGDADGCVFARGPLDLTLWNRHGQDCVVAVADSGLPIQTSRRRQAGVLHAHRAGGALRRPAVMATFPHILSWLDSCARADGQGG